MPGREHGTIMLLKALPQALAFSIESDAAKAYASYIRDTTGDAERSETCLRLSSPLHLSIF